MLRNLSGVIIHYSSMVALWQIKIDWLPNYSEIKRALEIYGFRSDFPSRFSSDVEMVNAGKLFVIFSW